MTHYLQIHFRQNTQFIAGETVNNNSESQNDQSSDEEF